MKINVNYLGIVLMALPLFVNADVYKCKNATGKIIYQAEPCTFGSINQAVIKVKQMTPEEAELAKAKLRAWQNQQAVEETAKKAANAERQAEFDRQEKLELERRSVMAQEQQAAAAAAAAQKPAYVGGGGVFIPPYPYGPAWGHGYHLPYGMQYPGQMQQPQNLGRQIIPVPITPQPIVPIPTKPLPLSGAPFGQQSETIRAHGLH